MRGIVKFSLFQLFVVAAATVWLQAAARAGAVALVQASAIMAVAIIMC